jgi:hypothetical protein
MEFTYTIERGVRFPNETMSLMGFRRHVVETGQLLHINENASAAAIEYGQPGALQGEAAKSVVFAPLLVGSEVRGVISLQNLDRDNAFSESDLKLLTTLAASLSVALENVRLVEEMRQRVARGPVRWELTFDLAQEGDPTDDQLRAWPASRTRIHAGTLTLTGEHPDQDVVDGMVFDPTNVPTGIACSDDPLLAFRSAVYSASHAARTREAKPLP